MIEIDISDNIQVSQWSHGQWIIFASTETEDGKFLGFTKGFGSKANTIKIAKQWAKLSKSELVAISNL